MKTNIIDGKFCMETKFEPFSLSQKKRVLDQLFLTYFWSYVKYTET